MKPEILRKHFIEALYSTLDGVVSPTPYMEITEGDRVDVKFLHGRGGLPKANSTEVSILDIDVASLFFDDFHILYEGITGVGKTYTSDALFHTLFGAEGHNTIRLGGGLLGMSALEPFTTTTLEQGVPKTHVDQDKCQRYGALFIDEINRGDSQEVFQVVDGVIHVNGDTGYLRLPISGTDRYKKVAIIAAMNPPDAQHSSALELDIAGENRFLKFQFPNGIDEAAASQLDKRTSDDLHARFWNEFRKRTNMKGTWRELYPVVTDSQQLRTDIEGEAREFMDVALGYVGKNPEETVERNRELLKSAGYEPRIAVVRGNDLDRVLQAQKTMKHGFVRRDLRKISDLALLLGFIKSVKKGTYEPTASLYDIAASVGIVLESKKITGSSEGQLMSLVNDALNAYRNIHQQKEGDMRVYADGFGIRQAVWQAAMYAGQDAGFDAYRATLQKGVRTLNTQTAGVAQAALKSRLASDIAVLDHFSREYQGDIEKALRSTDPFAEWKEVYDKHKSRSSVYEHRLSSIVR